MKKKRFAFLAVLTILCFEILGVENATKAPLVVESQAPHIVENVGGPPETTRKEVKLDSELKNVYKYCPTSLNGNVLYCSNEETPGEVKDGIYLNDKKVLGTTKGSWDSVQVCDPSVVAGEFTYQCNSYKYLMAYLGCSTYDCTVNEIGFALSNDLYNWTKTGKVVSAVRDGCWGVGQPSLLNYEGDIFLFYTSGTTAETTTYVEKLDCSDLGNITRLGKQKITCSYDFISNADFAYANGTLYMTCDTHPFPAGAQNFISAVQSVYSASWDGSIESLGNMNWQKVASIGSSVTGHERNHNGCFVRDEYGGLTSNTIYVTTADAVGSWSDNLYTYRFTAVNF